MSSHVFVGQPFRVAYSKAKALPYIYWGKIRNKMKQFNHRAHRENKKQETIKERFLLSISYLLKGRQDADFDKEVRRGFKDWQ